MLKFKARSKSNFKCMSVTMCSLVMSLFSRDYIKMEIDYSLFAFCQEKNCPPENFYPRTKFFSDCVENFCPTLKIFVRLVRLWVYSCHASVTGAWYSLLMLPYCFIAIATCMIIVFFIIPSYRVIPAGFFCSRCSAGPDCRLRCQ